MPDIQQGVPSGQTPPMGCASRLFLCLVLLVIGYSVYKLVSQEFWDWRVRRMCAAEGGVTVFVPEKVRIEPRFVRGGVIRPPVRIDDGTVNKADWEYREGDPYFVRMYWETIHGGDLSVERMTVEVVRAPDNFVLGRSVQFGRFGGDIFPIDSSTRFICPSDFDSDVINQVFTQ